MMFSSSILLVVTLAACAAALPANSAGGSASATSQSSAPTSSGTTSSLSAIINAIQTIPLASSDSLTYSSVPVVSDGVDQGFVNRGSLQTFLAEIPAQSRDDALYWTLFAQLAADYNISRANNGDLWYQRYVYVLGQIGMSTGSYSFSSLAGSSVGASVNLAALGQLAAILTEPELAFAKVAIQALANPDNQQNLNLFNSQSSNSKNANFQASDGEVDAYLNLNLKTSMTYINTNQNIQNFLFFKFTNTNFTWYQSFDNMTLSKTIADQTRASLTARLGANIQKNIFNIPLA